MSEKVEVVSAASELLNGARTEPEEKPVIVTQQIKSIVSMGHGPTDPNARQIATKTTTLQAVVTAEEFATGSASRCLLCKHHDRAWWRDALTVYEASQDPFVKTEYAKMLSMVVDASDTKADLHAKLQEFGVCRAYTAFKGGKGEELVTHFDGVCPTSVPIGKGEARRFVPCPKLFSPRDAASEAMSGKLRDDVLLAAAGKK